MKLTNNLYMYPEQAVLDCNTYVIKGKPGIMPIPARFRGFKAVYLACLASVLALFCPEITPRFIYFQF